ncbi:MULTISPECIES: acyl-CoA dehydrogenase family protein [Rhizobium]|uniref:Acyl-CoA dehydrogenase n=1 Tax=Rhizobium favelukesii TaxID=348824 RepID=W6RHW9_9HYPH|nr:MULTISPECIES: acyl-CoA dehydrogenase family protein [Rhizobium]MCA0807054.1 acyl-CoA dehydrogenase family protein [Rhizobium sp. T1473]MCS0460225.1 acyl-CoA dehydrogenase family protein [Rhizobium favelukesii]UFS85516.1 acyl-CoA dehydrogenase family protein [Rhizobium sp. T136]CDM60802.1 acyl-CoA dehydrogenase [Rhizobium favelukesii]
MTVKPTSFEPALPPALFEQDQTNPYLAKAIELREIFALDAAERDQQGGRPSDEIRRLKESDLVNLLIPTEFGGEGQPYSTALRIVREFAKVDGSLAHLFGYHFSPIQNAVTSGSDERSAAILRRSAEGRWFWGNTTNSFSKSLFGRKVEGGVLLNGDRPFASGSHVADYLMVAWEDEKTNARNVAYIPANRAGITIADDWDGIGQRQTGSGRVFYKDVTVRDDEILLERPKDPSALLIPQQQQSVLLNVFVGSAQGALIAAREYTVTTSRPWIYSGVERHSDDPWIKRQYGELWTKVQAATALADRAASAMDSAYAKGAALTAQERGATAIAVACANVLAGKVALEVTSEIFEVMGARSAVRPLGFDRFWRNVRIHTLHNPAEYKTRNVGAWFLTGDYPEPGIFQ